MTLRQSGRLAVTSKSMTASPSPIGSMDATSNPRSPTRSAISSAGASMSTKSRSHETSRRIYVVSSTAIHHGTTKLTKTRKTLFPGLRVLRGSVRELLQKPQIVLVEQPDVFDPIAQDRDP